MPAAVFGLPIAAAGIAGLVYRGRTVLAGIAAATGVGLAALLAPSAILYAAPAVLAILLAVVALPKRHVQLVAGALIAAFTLTSAGYDAFVAQAAGTTLLAEWAAQSKRLMAEMTKSLGASATADIRTQLDGAASFVASAWPSVYFQWAVIMAVIVIAAISWAARRTETPLDVPRFSQVDITPHVLWAFVAGLLLLAASYASFSASVTLGVVGLNLVLCARTLFFLQGMSVSAGVLDRAGVGLGGRILALAALAALDALTFAISFTGLMDFWVNFRRLPRDGEMPVVPETSARRW